MEVGGYYKTFYKTQNYSSDIRVKDWPLMQNVFPTVVMVIIYVIAIVFGRKWMKNRKPFELRSFMFIYNFMV